ncbi:MAG: hypothetical protein VYA84_11325 [Planctomycetota bacterium]|nr:hypothetical protein [Planctomycetota bacterium]
MRQKLAVCCAYLFAPQVLLLDEPLTGLDPPGIRVLLRFGSRTRQSRNHRHHQQSPVGDD